jgi:hypothetical protein
VSEPGIAACDKGDPTCAKLLRTWSAICSGEKLEVRGGPLRAGISFMVQEELDFEERDKEREDRLKVEVKRLNSDVLVQTCSMILL